jgi:iron complex outermembrane receptor protein
MANKFAAAVCGVCFAFTASLHAQLSDTLRLQEVSIPGFFRTQPLLRSPASVALLDTSQLTLHHRQSLLPAMNTVPGVRMEERSPGSYRLSIRGSLLRSPFGIRNVKMYVNRFPFTDAGGNTYLNVIDAGAIDKAEIYKGPDGSLFGANSGGVVNFDVADTNAASTAVALTGGSYGLLHFNASSALRFRKNTLILKEGWQVAQGYREQSAMRRQYFQLYDTWNYNEGMHLSLVFFQSDLDYQTPGGLTKAQFDAEPRSARPATATLPGAVEQRAGLHNQMYFGGISHEAEIVPGFLTHSFSVFGSVAEIENPFITNYEYRGEKNGGIRTFLNAQWQDSSSNTLNAWVGFEGQKSLAQIDNYTNSSGTPGALMVAHDLNAVQYFGFARVVADLGRKIMLEAATSINIYAVEYAPVYPVEEEMVRRNFTPQWMPKFAASWLFTQDMAVRASVARGYSAPTLAEIRASDNTINTRLQPETGWNYELGMRMEDRRGIVRWDWSAFYYQLDKAIVRRLNDNGEEYFVNSGATAQPGFESMLEVHALRERTTGFFRSIVLRNSYAYSAFRFVSYMIDTIDYSGNRLTGVPEHVLTSSAAFAFTAGFELFVQHTYVSDTPLNDANTEYAGAYNLVELKVTWSHSFRRIGLQVFAGADNLLDEKYSLGNDLNAGGNRYYNPAPGRNYYGGIGVTFN